MLSLLLYRKSGDKELSTPVLNSSTYTLRQMIGLNNGAHVVKISAKAYRLSNGVEYCHVGVKCKDESIYSFHAYGKEAMELHEEASKVVEIPVTVS